MLYPPTFNLRSVERDGTGDRQLTFGDQSYEEPDVHMSGMLAASRVRVLQSDIWKFPVNGTPAENTRRGIPITHQTGHAQTPSISPDESEVVYLSDSRRPRQPVDSPDRRFGRSSDYLRAESRDLGRRSDVVAERATRSCSS